MRMRTLITSPLAIVALTAGLALSSVPLLADHLPETFTAFAVNTNGGASTATVDIHITRWSSDAERNRLLGILKEEKDPTKANEALLTALQKLPKVGYIKTATSVAWDLRYARETAGEDGGRQLVLATDRPISAWEARSQSRTLDYPFTVVELHLDKNNTGEGKLLAGTKIYIDKNSNLVLENYAIQPVMLNNIKKIK